MEVVAEEFAAFAYGGVVAGDLFRSAFEVAEAISIRSVIDDGEGSVADVLAKPINDLVVVLQMPAGVERAAPAPAAK